MALQTRPQPRFDHVVLRMLSGAVFPAIASEVAQGDMATARISLETIGAIYGGSRSMTRLIGAVTGVEEVEVSGFLLPKDKPRYKAGAVARLGPVNRTLRDAMRQKRLRVMTADEVPELNMQPNIRYRLWGGGQILGQGIYTPDGFDRALYDRWGAQRWQRIIGKAYIYYDL